MKKGAGGEVILTNTPQRLWDDCLKYEAYVHSYTAHDKSKLERGVTKTIVPRETTNTSQFCELGWYKWVEFGLAAISFPEDQLVLRKYLGQSIYFGPTMTAKILTLMGKVVHCSIYRPLIPEELADPVKQDHMKGLSTDSWGPVGHKPCKGTTWGNWPDQYPRPIALPCPWTDRQDIPHPQWRDYPRCRGQT